MVKAFGCCFSTEQIKSGTHKKNFIRWSSSIDQMLSEVRWMQQEIRRTLQRPRSPLWAASERRAASGQSDNGWSGLQSDVSYGPVSSCLPPAAHSFLHMRSHGQNIWSNVPDSIRLKTSVPTQSAVHQTVAGGLWFFFTGLDSTDQTFSNFKLQPLRT